MGRNNADQNETKLDAEIWFDANAKYLAASLLWLRLKLYSAAQDATLEETGVADQLAQAYAERQSAAQINPVPALLALGNRLGLTVFEQDLLLLCASLELDVSIAHLCERILGAPYVTYALAQKMFTDPTWESLSPDRPLRYWRLIEINQHSPLPLILSALRVDERIINYIRGLNTLDDRLGNFLSPLPQHPAGETLTLIAPSQQKFVDLILQRWQDTPEHLPLPVVQLLGPDPLSKQMVAVHTAHGPGLQVYYLSSTMLPPQTSEMETLALLWQRESRLHPLALYLDVQDEEAGVRSAIQHFILRADGIIFLGTRDTWQNLGRASFSIEINRPTPAEQRLAWESVLGRQAQAIARRLAAQFHLNLDTIRQIAQTASASWERAAETLEPTLWALCRETTRPNLDVLAQRIEPKAAWENLVLPTEQAALLSQIADQVAHRQTVYEDWGFGETMNRGFGISALFTGVPGTGKSMAAEVIAHELQLNLYRIDLSGVVSKYIGETEKNLRRLFDAAEDGGAILFFDEADAVFGKRSDVKDSHDRYANIEVNYLLQRLEAYRGLSILATNNPDSLDRAFLRRLRFIVNFPFPEPNERKIIWQKVFPARTPLEPLDYDHLARFNITGSDIHNIALNAAFLAAKDGVIISQAIVLSAIRSEYRKLGKGVFEADPVWQVTESEKPQCKSKQ